MLDAGAVVLFFPAPSTTTGENVLELHTHGSPAIVRAVFAAISQCSTPRQPIRPAEPGEFTRRAFLNDRLSLPQVEALGSTLAAVTEEQRRLSVQSSSVDLSKRYDSWRAMLLAARGELEALIDFSEDQHLDEPPALLAGNVAAQVRDLAASIEVCSRNAVRGELLRNGIAVSLIGAPNVGKSSILNQIVGRNAAIVSGEAGTTRDVVEVGIDLGGFYCRFGDTAGLRQTSQVIASPSRGAKANGHEKGEPVGEVEAEGIRRAKAQALQSDVIILVFCVEQHDKTKQPNLHVPASLLDTARELIALNKKIVVAVNKVDLCRPVSASPDSEAEQFNAPQQSTMRTVITRALPSISYSDIHFISVHEASSGLSSSTPSSVTPTSQLHQVTNKVADDPGNFQAFLTSLTRTFRSLTTPLRPDPELSKPSFNLPHHPNSSRRNGTGGSQDPSAMASDNPGGGEVRIQIRADTSSNSTSSHPALDPESRRMEAEAPASASADGVRVDTHAAADDSVWEASLGATERQRILLESCLSCLHQFLTVVEPSKFPREPHKADCDIDIDIVLAAEHLRSAANALGKVTGKNEAGGVGDVEEVLGVVFEKYVFFCFVVCIYFSFDHCIAASTCSIKVRHGNQHQTPKEPQCCDLQSETEQVPVPFKLNARIRPDQPSRPYMRPPPPDPWMTVPPRLFLHATPPALPRHATPLRRH